jgi:hypothetical protein
MNRKSLIVGLAIAAAAAAVSAESYEEYNPPFVSSASRADVQAELVQARRSGVNPWSTSYNPLSTFRSEKTRAQVTAEYISARDLVSAFTGEDSGSGYLAGRPAAAGETRLAIRR